MLREAPLVDRGLEEPNGRSLPQLMMIPDEDEDTVKIDDIGKNSVTVAY